MHLIVIFASKPDKHDQIPFGPRLEVYYLCDFRLSDMIIIVDQFYLSEVHCNLIISSQVPVSESM